MDGFIKQNVKGNFTAKQHEKWLENMSKNVKEP